jgi:hypothetical protein
MTTSPLTLETTLIAPTAPTVETPNTEKTTLGVSGNIVPIPAQLKIQTPKDPGLTPDHDQVELDPSTPIAVNFNGTGQMLVAFVPGTSSRDPLVPNGGIDRPTLLASTGANRANRADINRNNAGITLDRPANTGSLSSPPPNLNPSYINLFRSGSTVAPISVNGSVETVTTSPQIRNVLPILDRVVGNRLDGLSDRQKQAFFSAVYVNLQAFPNSNREDIELIVSESLAYARGVSTPPTTSTVTQTPGTQPDTYSSTNPPTTGTTSPEQQRINNIFSTKRNESIAGQILQTASRLESSLTQVPAGQTQNIRNAVNELRFDLHNKAEAYNFNLAQLESAKAILGSNTTATTPTFLYSVNASTGRIEGQQVNLNLGEVNSRIQQNRQLYQGVVARTQELSTQSAQSASSSPLITPEQLEAAKNQANASFTQVQQGQSIEQVRGTLRQNAERAAAGSPQRTQAELTMALFDSKVVRQQVSQLGAVTPEQQAAWNDWAAA